MTKLFLPMAVALGLLIGGCTSNKNLTSQRSGFLADYSSLKPSPYQPSALLYVTSDINTSYYENVIVEPVKIIANNEQIKANAGLLKEMSEYLTQKVRNALNKNPNFKLVTKPREKTFRLEFALTSVTVSYEDRRFYQYIPVALVITEAARASGASQKDARVLMELRITDANTGKVLARVVDSQAGKRITLKEEDLTLKHLKPALDNWAKNISKRLTYFKKKLAE